MRLVLTPGMGIGPEVTARALSQMNDLPSVTVMGDAAEIRSAMNNAGVEFVERDEVCDCAGVCIVDTRASALPAPVAAIDQAARACIDGHADAMVTGPIHKAKLIDQGFNYMGHTDMLGAICGVDPVMAFVGGAVRVALVTTHIPLSEVRGAITEDGVRHTIRTAHRALINDLGLSRPRLALCGLNPHAGESGQLGDCEEAILAPVARELRKDNIDVRGPISAETAFMEAVRGGFDMVIAMYHDQGLVPLKALSFGESVNWTIGLPIVRTSVDHGTAYDLVGTGMADPSSMAAAIRLAMEIVDG